MEFPLFVSTLRVFDWRDFDLSIKGEAIDFEDPGSLKQIAGT